MKQVGIQRVHMTELLTEIQRVIGTILHNLPNFYYKVKS